MKMTRPKFTVRWLMVVVAIAGVVTWGEARRARFEKINQHLKAEWRELVSQCSDDLPILSIEYNRAAEARLRYLQEMHRKYERASRYPWFPVAPDPPEPIRP